MRMRDPITCRIFEKILLRIVLSQSTSKHNFEAKIIFLSYGLQKKSLASRVVYQVSFFD